MATSSQAPGPLEDVRAFVNTRDVESGTDALSTPTRLREWLVARNLLSAGEPVDLAGVADAVEVREAIRAVLLSHNGGPEAAEAVRILNDATVQAGLVPQLVDGLRTEARVTGVGVPGALGRLIAIVHAAAADGTWERLKACPDDACHWAFFDQSRNRSGRWCSMDVCGNRNKGRALRARRRGDAGV